MLDEQQKVKKVREFTETLAAALANREERYSVEVRDSIVYTRMYLAASKPGEHFAVQIDLL